MAARVPAAACANAESACAGRECGDCGCADRANGAARSHRSRFHCEIYMERRRRQRHERRGRWESAQTAGERFAGCGSWVRRASSYSSQALCSEPGPPSWHILPIPPPLGQLLLQIVSAEAEGAHERKTRARGAKGARRRSAARHTRGHVPTSAHTDAPNAAPTDDVATAVAIRAAPALAMTLWPTMGADGGEGRSCFLLALPAPALAPAPAILPLPVHEARMHLSSLRIARRMATHPSNFSEGDRRRPTAGERRRSSLCTHISVYVLQRCTHTYSGQSRKLLDAVTLTGRPSPIKNSVGPAGLLHKYVW